MRKTSVDNHGIFKYLQSMMSLTSNIYKYKRVLSKTITGFVAIETCKKLKSKAINDNKIGSRI